MTHCSFLVTTPHTLCKNIESIFENEPQAYFQVFLSHAMVNMVGLLHITAEPPIRIKIIFLPSNRRTAAGSSSNVAENCLNFRLQSSELDSMHMVKTETMRRWTEVLETMLAKKREEPTASFASFQCFLEPVPNLVILLLIQGTSLDFLMSAIVWPIPTTILFQL